MAAGIEEIKKWVMDYGVPQDCDNDDVAAMIFSWERRPDNKSSSNVHGEWVKHSDVVQVIERRIENLNKIITNIRKEIGSLEGFDGFANRLDELESLLKELRG